MLFIVRNRATVRYQVIGGGLKTPVPPGLVPVAATGMRAVALDEHTVAVLREQHAADVGARMES